MPNARDVGQEVESILLVGSTGGGKTTQFLTFPGRKFAYVFDTNALASLRGHDVEYEEFIPEHLDLDVVSLSANKRDRTSKPPEPKTYQLFETDFETRLRNGFFNDIDAISIDSTTMLTDIVMDRVLYINGRFGKQPEMTDYVATTNTMIKLYRTILGLGVPVFITGHIEFQKDETTGRMQNVMAFLGRLRQRFPMMFSEVWLAYGDVDKDGKVRYYVQTRQDRQNPFLRCTHPSIGFKEDVTIDFTQPTEGQGVYSLLNRAMVRRAI